MDARELAKLFTSLDVHLMEHEILLVIEEIDDWNHAKRGRR